MSDIEPVEILLAEDTATDAEMTLRALRKANLGNHIVWVKDGQAVLDFLFMEGPYQGHINGSPKLVLLDLKMPKLDGIEVLRVMKKDPRTRAIPVVMLTSSAEESDITQSYNLGVNSYLVKPVNFEKLTQVVIQAGLYWLVTNKIPA
jgi:two-component system, response regulator